MKSLRNFVSREPRGNFMSGQWDSLPREQFGCVVGDFYWDKYLVANDICLRNIWCKIMVDN